MKTCLAVTALLLALAAPAQTQYRYIIETHLVASSLWSEKVRIATEPATNLATFKLNTERGTVWRLESNRFVRINGPDLGGKNDIDDWITKRFLGRLTDVVIPELNLKSEPFTNVLLVLEQKIKEQEPAFRIGPGHFLVLTNGYGTGVPEITFSGKGISAFQAIKILASVAGLQYTFRKDVLYFSEQTCDEGSVEHAWYRVSPDLQELCRTVSITNVLEELGMRPFPQGCGCVYHPESNQLFVANTYRGHRELKELLYRNQLLPPEIGRFRFQSLTGDNGPVLWLIDQKTGETWRYQRYRNPEYTDRESFSPVPYN